MLKRIAPFAVVGAALMVLGGCEGKPGVVANTAGVADKPGGPAKLALTLKDHRFTPAELRVPAGQPLEIVVTNADPLADEFDSSDLKVEKVIAGGQSGTVRIHPLAAGRYTFAGEYHAATAQGVLIAE